MSYIDWTTELKKIEREFSGLPPEPSVGQMKAKRAAEQREVERRHSRNAAVGAAWRIAVVAALASGLQLWPYAHVCGIGLLGYLGAQLLVLSGGVWAALYTWQFRQPRMHLVAIGLVLLGMVVLAAEVLPRTGYARTPTGVALPWGCSARSSR